MKANNKHITSNVYEMLLRWQHDKPILSTKLANALYLLKHNLSETWYKLFPSKLMVQT